MSIINPSSLSSATWDNPVRIVSQSGGVTVAQPSRNDTVVKVHVGRILPAAIQEENAELLANYGDDAVMVSLRGNIRKINHVSVLKYGQTKEIAVQFHVVMSGLEEIIRQKSPRRSRGNGRTFHELIRGTIHHPLFRGPLKFENEGDTCTMLVASFDQLVPVLNEGIQIVNTEKQRLFTFEGLLLHATIHGEDHARRRPVAANVQAPVQPPIKASVSPVLTLIRPASQAKAEVVS